MGGKSMFISILSRCSGSSTLRTPTNHIIHAGPVTLSHGAVPEAVRLLVPHPAVALVDDRMSGDGTGKALGINDPILGWIMIGVFTVVWAAFYTATKEFGGQREEGGLGL